MTVVDVEKALPHRYPFLMVDSVIKYKRNEQLSACKNISRNEPNLQGHFPGSPLFPGVLIVEALAQAAGVLLSESCSEQKIDNPMYYLVGSDKTRFKRKVLPGDQLLLEVDIISNKKHLIKIKGTASVEGELACSTILSLFREEREIEQEFERDRPNKVAFAEEKIRPTPYLAVTSKSLVK
jgi:3-hydroxyacyl-[acyl-carrier-protein] dehydratase